ncbi:MAG: hypothetical protein K0B00_05400 [Rhodobacteraceae bacterium]|nr:hypothetical protein [Paracoccaceae bacterium]
MLELKQNGTLIQTVRNGGWFTLPNGDRVSPAQDGWSNDDGYTLAEAPVPPAPTDAEVLAAERAGMVCSPLQGKLTLGQAAWAAVEAYRDDPATPWSIRVIIDDAADWRRVSENMQLLAYLLGYSDAEMDDLFRAAMQVVV